MDQYDLENYAYDDWKDKQLRSKNSRYHAEMRAKMKARTEAMNRIISYRKGIKKMAATFNIKKRENSPDFVVGSFGCKFGDLEPFVNSKGYINFDILKGKEGGMYVKINEYGLDKPAETTETVTKIGELTEDEIPF